MEHWQAEVYEVSGGAGVGTSVKACSTLTAAVRFIAGSLENGWAYSWRIIGPEWTLSSEGDLNPPP